MAEKLIIIEGIDPVKFHGVHNSNINYITSKFPKLKVVVRGNDIRVFGDADEIDDFEQRLNQLAEHIGKYGSITEASLRDMFDRNQTVQETEGEENINDVLVYGNNGRIVKARTVNQQKLVEMYKTNDLLFATGPAGSGKTYTAIALAVRALRNKTVQRIILTRPAVEAGERLGFLPGDMKEKLDPYLQPLYDALNDMIPPRKLAEYMEDGTVQIAPLAYMRGRTLDNAFVILDEAQNTTLNQLKMFLTRMGTNAKFIVTGDMTQIDLPRKSDSGLLKAKLLLSNIKGISFIDFDNRDILRHPLVSHIVKAFETDSEQIGFKPQTT
ncbi:MAG: PhoH family protein [Prevotellaceae bacterium]|jgi:phosphate starvation-inducible PhoH-like protein|nr:PhoH family protein [Prevotellaceae bacterium]